MHTILKGIKVTGSANQFKNNVVANNGSYEYDLTGVNIDAGGNKANGRAVTLKAGYTE